MAKLVKANPTSPGRRFVTQVARSELYKGKPFKGLLSGRIESGGRNNQGKMTVYHRGGGHKRRYRQVDFKRNKVDILGRVERLEYDPNRTAHLALILYADGERRYILAPQGLAVGSSIMSGTEATIKPGNCLPIRNIPLGTILHAIELRPGKGAQLARSAGSSVTLLAREGAYASLRLASSEVRKVSIECKASIGIVGNSEHALRSLGKAGANRWRGRRPTVRGVAMNPVDHPLGGGEGKTSGGRPPVSRSGIPEGSVRRNNKRTDRFIITSRKKK
jgi:large subunit ribosomal protein L2